ncbi:PD-(D/E)XK nuclease family transposase [Mitsuokella multacida]|uniref:PD-(D/E)XK nuclease family transposase n=1 Tax=Mitsuokella multacida TaxID=52226 RepID=UPI0022E482E6|nr:PD-(D/E)XK nuclease family transposase [Mitsuokella multacida]
MNSSEEALYGNRNAAYDQAAKKVLSQKKILAFILKRMVEEFKDESVQDIMTKYIEGTPLISQVPVHPDETNQEIERIHGNNTEDGSISEGMVRYDILFQALVPKTKEPLMLIINIEAQGKAKPGYSILKRATYYASRMISSQRGRDFYGDDYDKIKKVYTIWICMNAPKDTGNSINRYRMMEERLHRKYHAEQWQYNILNVVMLYLGDRKTQDDLIEMLRIIFKEKAPARVKKQQLEEAYGIRLTEDETKELSKMCNLSEGLYNSGFNDGTYGRAKTDLRNLIESTGWSLAKAMEMLRIPPEEKENLEKELQKKH